MQRLFPKTLTSGSLLTALLLAFGCAAPDSEDNASREQEIAGLKAQSDRRQEAIARAQETIVGLREEIEQLGRERSKLSSELALLESKSQLKSELAARLEAKSTETGEKLAKAEEARLKLERTHLQVIQILDTVQFRVASLSPPSSSGSEKLPPLGHGPGSLPSGTKSFSETVAWLGTQVQIARNLLLYPAAQGEMLTDSGSNLSTLEPELRSDAAASWQGPVLDDRRSAEKPPQAGILAVPRASEPRRPVTVGFWSSFASLVGGHVGSLFQQGKALTAADVTFLGAILVFVVACVWILATPVRIFLRAHRDKELGLLRRVVKALERKGKEGTPAAASPQVALDAPEEEEPAAAPEESAPKAADPTPCEAGPSEVGEPSAVEADVVSPTPSDDDRTAGHHDTQHIGSTAQDDFVQTQILPGAIQEDFTRTQEMPKVSEDEFKNTQLIAGAAEPGPSRAVRVDALKDLDQSPVFSGVLDEPSRTQQMPSAEEEFRATQALPEIAMDEFAATQMMQKPASKDVGRDSGAGLVGSSAAGPHPGKDPKQSEGREGEKPLNAGRSRIRPQKSASAGKSSSPLGELSSNKELLDELEQLMGKRLGRPK